MREVMDDPGRKKLLQRHPPELRMRALELQRFRADIEASKLIQITRTQRLEKLEELGKRSIAVLLAKTETVEPRDAE